MKKIQQMPVAAAERPAAAAGLTSLAPPQMAAQRQRAALMDSSPQALRLKSLAQRMRRTPVAQLAPVAQLGPRDYAKTFKPRKKEMMDWLKEGQLIGMDLGESEEVDLANEQIGWHHQYPYSILYESRDYRYMADHGANLRLGPMKNRLSDPGDDIDVAYGKARRRATGGPRDDIEPTYAPYSQKLIKELLKPERPADGKLLDGIALPVLEKGTPNEVFEDDVDKEAYWSEWYLSANIRALRVSARNVADAIAAYRRQDLTGATARISARLNVLLDGMQYSYVTHTPAQIEGHLGKFQNAPQVETGIPSSKLNRRGPLAENLIGSTGPTYADLMHTLLTNDKSGKKWISRGSQGEAHSVVEQYKDKMKSGNAGLIWEVLQETDLAELKRLVEAAYKEKVQQCLLKLDNDRLPDLFFIGIQALQLTDRTEVLDEKSVKSIIKQLGEIAPLEKTSHNEVEVAPEEPAKSFVPQFDLNQKSWIVPIYTAFGTKKQKREDMEKIAADTLRMNALHRGDEPGDDGRQFMFDWQGKFILTVEDLTKALKTMLFGTGKVSEKDKFSEFAEALHAAINKIGQFQPLEVGGEDEDLDDEDNVGDDYDDDDYGDGGMPSRPGRTDYRQTPGREWVEAEDKTVDPDKIYAHFQSSYRKTGLHYIRHLDAIATPSKREAYCDGIEQALRIPGKGYTNPALTYSVPKAVRDLPASSGWNFNEQQETEFRTAWHDKEFRPFLRTYLAEPAVQATLLRYVPSAEPLESGS